MYNFYFQKCHTNAKNSPKSNDLPSKCMNSSLHSGCDNMEHNKNTCSKEKSPRFSEWNGTVDLIIMVSFCGYINICDVLVQVIIGLECIRASPFGFSGNAD